jgi:ribosomal-protein-alanine N-acetyltransferase
MNPYLTQHQTERTLIRPLESRDMAAWEPFFEDPESLKFLPSFGNLSPAQIAENWINRQLTRYQENRFGLLAITEIATGNLLGMCGLLSQEVNGRPETEIGYHLLSAYRGQGFAAETAQYFKQFAFRHHLAGSLISIIHTGNIASQKVAEKNGMQRTFQTELYGMPVYIYRVGPEKQE